MTLLTASQAARRLGITPALVCRYCRQGRLGQRIGHQWLITEDELTAFAAIPRTVGNRTGRARRKVENDG